MKDKLPLLCLLASASLSMQAQKIDINLAGKENSSLADGYVNWSFGREKSTSQQFAVTDSTSIGK